MDKQLTETYNIFLINGADASLKTNNCAVYWHVKNNKVSLLPVIHRTNMLVIQGHGVPDVKENSWNRGVSNAFAQWQFVNSKVKLLLSQILKNANKKERKEHIKRHINDSRLPQKVFKSNYNFGNFLAVFFFLLFYKNVSHLQDFNWFYLSPALWQYINLLSCWCSKVKECPIQSHNDPLVM